jgi:hypothetical protein
MATDFVEISNSLQCIINVFLIIRQNFHVIWPVKERYKTQILYHVKYLSIKLNIFASNRIPVLLIDILSVRWLTGSSLTTQCKTFVKSPILPHVLLFTNECDSWHFRAVIASIIERVSFPCSIVCARPRLV